jgi:hypothetical protein
MIDKLTHGLLTIRPVWARRESFYLGKEFRELIARCRAQGIGMHGLEVFTPLGALLDVVYPAHEPGNDLAWCEAAMLDWPDPGVLFSGSLYRLDDDDQKNQTMVDLADAFDAFVAPSENGVRSRIVEFFP